MSVLRCRGHPATPHDPAHPPSGVLRPDRFWPFQLIETGWLLALSLLLMTAAVWLVHRRAT